MENDFGQIINYISGGKGGIGREGFFVTRACACARVQCLVYFSSYVSKIIFTRSEDFSRVSFVFASCPIYGEEVHERVT